MAAQGKITFQYATSGKLVIICVIWEVHSPCLPVLFSFPQFDKSFYGAWWRRRQGFLQSAQMTSGGAPLQGLQFRAL